MKKVILLAFIMACISVLACEGKKEDQAAVEQPEETVKTSEPVNMDERIAVNPNYKKETSDKEFFDRGPEMVPDELIPGTCEYTAFQFVEAFTSGDSALAISMCTDSMQNVVRVVFQTPGKLDEFKRNRNAGQTFESASLMSDTKDDFCHICLTVSFLGVTRTDCNFKFIKANGKWLLDGFTE